MTEQARVVREIYRAYLEGRATFDQVTAQVDRAASEYEQHRERAGAPPREAGRSQ